MNRKKEQPKNVRKLSPLERFAIRATRWLGSTQSLVVHTVFFVAIFFLYFLGIDLQKILIIVTTIVSYEAIYLSIFIQMSVNRNTRQLREVSKDVEEIQEDVEEIQEDVEKIEKDVDEIQEDVEEIQVDVDEIQKDVDEIQEDVDEIEKDGSVEEVERVREAEVYQRIETTLLKLAQEIQEIKKKK